MLGHIALERVLALRVGHAGAEAEIGDALTQGMQAIQLHQIEVVAHAVDQMNRVGTALLGDFFQHGGERRQPGTTCQQQQGPLDLTQVKAAQRARQGHAVASLGDACQKAAHQPARDIADQEADLAILLQGAEGIGPALPAAGYLQVDILARQKRQAAQGLALYRQSDGALGQLLHIADNGIKTGLLGLAQGRRSRHPQYAVAGGAHLAGQHIALPGLLCAEGVFDIVLAQLVAASFGKALAGTAGTVAAVQRDIDALAVSGVSDGFLAIGLDKTGNSVFEVEGNLKTHNVPRRQCPARAPTGTLRHASQP